MSASDGPSQRSACQPPGVRRRPTCVPPPPRLLAAGARPAPAGGCRPAARRDRCSAGRRRLPGLRQRVEVWPEPGVAAHAVDARSGDGKKTLGGDPARDVLGLVVELEELLHRLLVARLLERHEVVLDAEGDRRVAVGRHRGDAVRHLALRVELRGERAEAHDHADLAVLEELEGAVGPVGLSRVHLGHPVAVREVGEELECLEVPVAVDGPAVTGLPVAAVVPHPDGPLRLSFFRPQGQRVADRAAAEVADLLGGLHELLPGPGGCRQAGPGEQSLVVEERTGAGEDREAVELAAVLAALGEGRQEVLAGPVGQHLVGRVEQPVLGVAGEGVEVQHVGRLVVLQHGGDLLVDRVPVDDLELDFRAGLLRVLRRQRLPERLRVVLAVVRDDDLDRCSGARAPVAGAERQRHAGHDADECHQRRSQSHRCGQAMVRRGPTSSCEMLRGIVPV